MDRLQQPRLLQPGGGRHYRRAQRQRLPNRTALSFTITGLSVSNGSTFWVRWADTDLTPGADDGLAWTTSRSPRRGRRGHRPHRLEHLPGRWRDDFPVGDNLSVTFSEAVNVTGTWFELVCSVTQRDRRGQRWAPTFTLDPATNLANGETCTLTCTRAGLGPGQRRSAGRDDHGPRDELHDGRAGQRAGCRQLRSGRRGNERATQPERHGQLLGTSQRHGPVVLADLCHQRRPPGDSLRRTDQLHAQPDSGLRLLASCATLIIHAANVSDQDSNDPPDNMAADFVVGFTPA